MNLGTPRTFAGYALVRRLAVSATAELFEARSLDLPVADAPRLTLKRLLPHAQEEPSCVARFVEEKALLARLDHPRVGALVTAGVHNGSDYVVLSYLEGQDLRVFVGPTRWDDPRFIAAIGAQLCDALHYVHGLRGVSGPLNVVHRDVSPHNVIVGRTGRLTLIDFGIAKHHLSRVRTATGTIQAKLGYASPEQVRGESLDHRSDIFSLGAVLWEIASGQRLFGGLGLTPVEILERCEAAELPVFPPAGHYGGDPSPLLWDIVRGMLSRAPTDRPTDCAVLSDVFAEVLRHDDPETIVSDRFAHLSREAAPAKPRSLPEGVPTP
ncbi:MAG: serine/threonine protein kinase [Myxococcota bacterium]|jgi:serine/threonine protein kinase